MKTLPKIPEEFFCPITGQIMYEPVFLCDGTAFEKDAIETWFQNHNTSPLTNIPLKNKDTTPVFLLKSMINKFLDEHPQHKTQQYSPKDACLQTLDKFIYYVGTSEQNRVDIKNYIQHTDSITILHHWLKELVIITYRRNLLRDVDIERMRILLQFGADPNQTVLSHECYEKGDSETNIPLLFLVSSLGDGSFAKEWIEQWNCSVFTRSSHASLLHWVAKFSTFTLLKYLVEEKGMDINSKDGEGDTPLEWTVEEPSSLQNFEYLLQQPNVVYDYENSRHRSPLFYAITSESWRQADLLLDRKVRMCGSSVTGFDIFGELLLKLQSCSNQYCWD